MHDSVFPRRHLVSGGRGVAVTQEILESQGLAVYFLLRIVTRLGDDDVPGAE